MSLIDMIKEQDEKYIRALLDLENFVCTLGRLVDDIIDKDLGLCVDYKLVEDAVELLQDKKWLDSTRSDRWRRVVQGLSDISVQKLTVIKLVDNQEDDLVEEEEQLRRDEKNGLYPHLWDDSN